MTQCTLCQSFQHIVPLWENELWLVRSIEEPVGVAGWMILCAKRHVAGPAHFNEREAASFGRALQHFEKILEEVTGAERIYSAALGEAVRHFHCHMVPRYADAAQLGWGLFDTQRMAKNGELTVSAARHKAIEDAYRSALLAKPFS